MISPDSSACHGSQHLTQVLYYNSLCTGAAYFLWCYTQALKTVNITVLRKTGWFQDCTSRPHQHYVWSDYVWFIYMLIYVYAYHTYVLHTHKWGCWSRKATGTFVTLAGVLPSLWVGGLVSAWGLGISLPVLPSNCQLWTVIYANWQVRAWGSAAIYV